MQNWEKRYHATSISSATIAQNNRTRGVVSSNQTGVTQLYAWDVTQNELRQLTHSANGKAEGAISPSGDAIYFVKDDKGNEQGQLVRIPWTGGEPEEITPGLEPYGVSGMNISGDGRRIAFIAYRADGFRLHIADLDADGKLSNLRELWHSTLRCIGVDISYDGSVIVIKAIREIGNSLLGLVAIDVASGAIIATRHHDSATHQAFTFVQRADSFDLVGTTTQSGFHRPYIWNPRTDTFQHIALPELDGDVSVSDLDSETNTLLLKNISQAEMGLYIYEIDQAQLNELDHASGSYMQAGFLDASRIYALWENARRPRSVVTMDRKTGGMLDTLLAADAVPEGRPWRSISFTSTEGAEIQAWLAVPEGDGPFPTILHTHGGPTSVLVETFSAESQSYLDHGFAWCSINYRGSTTFGHDFEKSIWGNLGVREVDDMIAARNWLVDNGIAQSDAIFLGGRSYGGYLTLQAAGRAPTLWAGGMADVAIADWNLMYEDQSEGSRQYQVSILGRPEDDPVAYAIASPITYAAAVQTPLLVIQGSKDPRCPARQLQVYEARMKSLGKSIDVHWYDAGHRSHKTELLVEHQRMRLEFALGILDKKKEENW